jgi:hypothetical protein
MSDLGNGAAQTTASPMATQNSIRRFLDKGDTSSRGVLSGAREAKNITSMAIM